MSDRKFDVRNEAQLAETTLGLLSAVNDGQPTTQRSLSNSLGVALGLTNTLLKRCVRKGWLKVSQAPARRYAYYLTPKGFQEKSRLTTQYISDSLSFYRSARLEYLDAIEFCRQRGWEKVAVYGSRELAEIACIAGHEAEFSLAAAIDPQRNSDRFVDLPVVHSPDDIEGLDAIILACAESVQETFDKLAATFPPQQIVVPPMLHVMRNREG